jgi:steroid 5-alpha reductase family enzyme
MSTSLKELIFAGIAFTVSYSIAIATNLDIVIDAVLLAFIIQWILFIPAYLLQTEKFYDISGSITYISVVSYCFFNNHDSENLNIGNVILSMIIIVWALRLGSFLFIRIKKAGEDIRFREIKKSPTRFFMTWTLQGMWVSMCLLCVLTALSSNSGIIMNNVFYIGLLIFVIGFIIEVIADHQKTVFRKNIDNKDKFISNGLWAYSRHPNYFGEILLWLGIAVMSFSSLEGFQYFTLISPIFVYILLVYISGIRMLENQANKKWGHLDSYKEYLKNTPRLFFRIFG